MVVEDAVRAANHRLAIAPRVPSQAYAWSHVVDVARNALGDSQRVLGSLRERIHRLNFRCELVVVANPVIECQVVAYLPGILQESADRVEGE